MNKKLDNGLRVVVVSLVTLAAVLSTLPFIQNYWAMQVSETSTTHYRQTLPHQIPKAETVHALKLRDLLSLKGQNVDAIGRVLIPSVGLIDNIYVGLTNGNLGLGAVTMFPDRVPKAHNMVLLGHNVGFTAIHFGVLEKAKVKDNVYLTYLNHDYQYQIDRIETINETALEKVKDTTQSRLTLVTCSAPTRTVKRLLVRARLVKVLKTTAEKQQLAAMVKVTTAKQLTLKQANLWQGVWLPILIIVMSYVVVLLTILKTMTKQTSEEKK
jgi:sortase A